MLLGRVVVLSLDMFVRIDQRALGNDLDLLPKGALATNCLTEGNLSLPIRIAVGMVKRCDAKILNVIDQFLEISNRDSPFLPTPES